MSEWGSRLAIEPISSPPTKKTKWWNQFAAVPFPSAAGHASFTIS
jgi:hypothetical protein